MSSMTPQEIVSELDHHIVGQAGAKRAVAIALRNRWRRQQVEGTLRHEITPKNILMIGPTGVGKTEIARRLARLADAPFIKVEATKFTEVGYVGKDVDSIIRDLAEIAVKQTRDAETRKVRTRAEDAAEERILDVLIPVARSAAGSEPPAADSTARQVFRKKLREGALDDKEIEIDVAESRPALEIMGPSGMEEMTEQLRGMFSQMGQDKRRTRKLKIAEALKLLIEEEAARLRPAGRENTSAGRLGRPSTWTLWSSLATTLPSTTTSAATVSPTRAQGWMPALPAVAACAAAAAMPGMAPATMDADMPARMLRRCAMESLSLHL